MKSHIYVRVVGISLLVATTIFVQIFSGAKYDDGDINAKYLSEDLGVLAWSVKFTPPARSKKFKVYLRVIVDGASSDIAILESSSPASSSDNQVLVAVQGREAVIRFNKVGNRGSLPFDASSDTLHPHNLGGFGDRGESNQFILLDGEDRALIVLFQFDQ